MHVALNGYFWDQPRTGSGQYLRHLWGALNSPAFSPDHLPAEHDTYTMLLPPHFRYEARRTDAALSAGRYRRVVYGRKAPLVGGRLTNLDKLLWEQCGVARMAKLQRAQVLHVPYLAAPMPLPGVKRGPVVVTAHDMIPWVLPGYSGSPAARLYFAVAAASVRRADLIVADSEASRRDVIKVLGVPPQRVRTVHLGVEQHGLFSKAQLQDVLTRHNLPDEYAFYLGGFDARKNVPLLLRAWREVSEAICREGTAISRPLLAIGGAVPQPGGIFPDVMGEAERLGLMGHDSPVRFLGRVSEEDKPLLMAGARLFVYPSAYEGFGLDPLEAMSVGCPVVASSGGSLAEVVGDAGLTVPPGDQQSLSQAITRAWSDPALRAELSDKGRQRARQFTWEHTAAQTYAAYRHVLNKSKRNSNKQ